MLKRLLKPQHLLIAAAFVFLGGWLVVKLLQDPERALLKQCTEEKVKPALLKQFDGPGGASFVTKHLAAAPIISAPDIQTGAQILKGMRSRDLELVGSPDRIDVAKKYAVYTVTYNVEEDPADGGVALQFILDRESRTIVFVRRLPQG